MKVLSIGTDRKLFEEGSAVLERALGYASKVEELHMLVFTLKKERLSTKKINNLYLYPTNSLSQWLYVLDALKLSKKVIVENKLSSGSVISTQDPFQTGFVGVCLKHRFNLPLQVQIHTDFLNPYFSKSFFNKIRRTIASFVIPRADGLRVVSEIIKSSLKKSFPNLKINIDVLPIFFDIDDLLTRSVSRLDFTQFRFIVFMASRLTKEKRIDTALRAFSKIVADFPQAGLVIAGDGPEKNNLLALTKSLLLTKNVIFLGWQNDLVHLYKTADVFLLTSEYEGHGMTLVEAGVFGCPIVTTRVGIAKTDIFVNGQNSFICPVGDIECLSKAVIDLIEHPEKRRLFKKQMQDSIKAMAISKEEYTAKYIALLEKVNES